MTAAGLEGVTYELREARQQLQLIDDELDYIGQQLGSLSPLSKRGKGLRRMQRRLEDAAADWRAHIDLLAELLSPPS